MFGEVFWRQMRVAADHGRGLPTAQFLQGMQRSPGLDVPTGPGMPQVVPPEIVDAGAHQCLSPRLGIGLQDRPSIEREHHGWVPPDLFPHDRRRLAVQRCRNRLPALCLIGMNPG